MKKTFEENLSMLEKLVHELENGETPLEDAIKKYTEASLIAKSCSDQLNIATESVNKILDANGSLKDFQIKDGE